MREKLNVAHRKCSAYRTKGLCGNLPGNIAEETLVRHVPRKVSHFCTFFSKYGGILPTVVRKTKFQGSPLPKGGREIPITLCVIKAESREKICGQMKSFADEYYLETEKIPINGEYQEAYI